MRRSRGATHSWNAATRTGRSSPITTNRPTTNRLAPAKVQLFNAGSGKRLREAWRAGGAKRGARVARSVARGWREAWRAGGAKRGARVARSVARGGSTYCEPARLEAERALTRGHELYPGVARRQQDRVAVFGEEFNGRVIVLFLPRALNYVPACSYGSGALAG